MRVESGRSQLPADVATVRAASTVPEAGEVAANGVRAVFADRPGYGQHVHGEITPYIKNINDQAHAGCPVIASATVFGAGQYAMR